MRSVCQIFCIFPIARGYMCIHFPVFGHNGIRAGIVSCEPIIPAVYGRIYGRTH